MCTTTAPTCRSDGEKARPRPTKFWVQPPGTPTVGLAYLKAYEAAQDPFYLDAATDAAEALIHGQLQSGAWTNCVDFHPRGQRLARYRNGKGGGENRNFSTLDDGISQAAIRLLIRVDQAHGFQRQRVHESRRRPSKRCGKPNSPTGVSPGLG